MLKGDVFLHDAAKPPPVCTARLRPITQESKHAICEIEAGGKVRMQFLKDGVVREVMSIAPGGKQAWIAS
jgi:hypothetical protein